MVQRRTRLPKLQAVARLAGVSVSTVSKVLNGRPDVAPATRARVADLLDRAGYGAVGAGGRGARRTTAEHAGKLVEVVANRLDDALTAKLLRAVCREAAVRGVGVIVSDVEPDGGPAGRHPSHPPGSWLDALDARGTGAVISLLMEFSETQRAYFEAHGVIACSVRVDERDRGPAEDVRLAILELLTPSTPEPPDPPITSLVLPLEEMSQAVLDLVTGDLRGGTVYGTQ